jgi:hypothetical protein
MIRSVYFDGNGENGLTFEIILLILKSSVKKRGEQTHRITVTTMGLKICLSFAK